VSDTAGRRRIPERLGVALRHSGQFSSEIRTWLKTPHGLLRGKNTLEHFDIEPGLREVKDLFTTLNETNAA